MPIISSRPCRVMQGESEKDMKNITLDILNAIDRVENRKTLKDFCDTCNRESCRYCDGRSKYKEEKEQAVG